MSNYKVYDEQLPLSQVVYWLEENGLQVSQLTKVQFDAFAKLQAENKELMRLETIRRGQIKTIQARDEEIAKLGNLLEEIQQSNRIGQNDAYYKLIEQALTPTSKENLQIESEDNNEQ